MNYTLKNFKLSNPLHIFRSFSPILLWITTVRSISAFGFALCMPFLALYLTEELGISITKVGLMLTVSGLLGSTAGAFGGSLSDQFGRRRLLLPLQFIRASLFIVIAYISYTRQPFFVFVILWVMNGIIGASTHPVTDAVVSDITTTEKRREAYGIQRVGGNLGWGLGPAIGGFIQALGYHIMFLFTSFFLFIGFIITFFKIPETFKPREGQKRTNMLRFAAEDHYTTAFLLISLAILLARGQLLATLSVHASSNLGIPKHLIGIIFFINAAMVTVFQVPWARRIQRYRSLNLMVIAGFLYGAGYFIVGVSGGFVGVVTGIVIVTIGEITESPTATAYVSGMAPEGKSGAYMGAYSMFLMTGWAVGPLLGGFLLDHTAHPTHAWTMIASLALCSCIGFMILQKFEKRVFEARGIVGLR